MSGAGDWGAPGEGGSIEQPEGVISDRRAAPRVRVSLPAEERGGGLQLQWTTTVVSKVGLSIRDSFSRPPRTRLRLSLDLLDGQAPLEVEAEVVGTYDEAGGVRVRFVALSEAQLARLERFLEPAIARQYPRR